jgi:uncharacterized Zn-finger protein
MKKYMRAKIDNDSQTMECPYCRCVIGVVRDSSYTKRGYPRLRYKNTIICSSCGNKFKMK